MTTAKTYVDLMALRNAAIEDLLNMSDEDIRKEATERGENLEEMAKQVKSSMQEPAARVMRERMMQAKSGSLLTMQSSGAGKITLTRPPLLQIKQIIQSLFASNPRLGLAYRDGKQQTDADWESLYEDLVAIGAINQNRDEL